MLDGRRNALNTLHELLRARRQQDSNSCVLHGLEGGEVGEIRKFGSLRSEREASHARSRRLYVDDVSDDVRDEVRGGGSLVGRDEVGRDECLGPGLGRTREVGLRELGLKSGMMRRL